MIVVYAVALVVGIAATAVWLFADALAANPTSSLIPPIRRFGVHGRDGMLGALGFGMGGLSGSFAGWPTVAAVLAAVGGAAFLVLSGRILADRDAAA